MVPDALIEAARAGRLALLVGRDLPRALTGAPSNEALARALAQQWGIPAQSSLATVGEALLPLRWKLAALRQFLPQGEPRPAAPLYEALAALPVRALMTTAYDDQWERALAAARRAPATLIRDNDLHRPHPLAAPRLLKLAGDGRDPATLVIAASQHQAMPDDGRLALWGQVTSWLGDHCFLILGSNPEPGSDWARWQVGGLLAPRGPFRPGSVLLWPAPSPEAITHWQARGVTVLAREALPVVEALATALGDLAPPLDPAAARLRRLAALLRGPAATPAELRAALGAIPPAQRPTTIRLTLRLQLSAAQTLQSRLRVDYLPDIEGQETDELVSTLTLTELQAWAAGAEQRSLLALEAQGQTILAAILPPDSPARATYERALRDAGSLNAALTLVIEPQHAALEPLPWELLNDRALEGGRGFWGRRYALYRRPHSTSTLRQVAGQIERALIVAVDPTGTLPTLAEEAQAVQASLSAQGVHVTCLLPDDPRLSDPATLKELLRQGGYHLFHFIGHGHFEEAAPAASYLQLGRLDEYAPRLTAHDLEESVADSALILVYLSACEVGRAGGGAARAGAEAGIAAALVRGGVPAVVGMRWTVGNAAQQLAATFYAQLCQHHTPPEVALREARLQASRDDPIWRSPVLLKRHGVLG